MRYLLPFVLMLACQNPNVAPIISNGAACAVDVIEDISGAVDIGKTATDCGLTALEIYQLVSSLLSNMPEAGAVVATHAGQNVARVDYINHLQQWQQAAKQAAGVK